MTDKDYEDLKFGLDQGVDAVPEHQGKVGIFSVFGSAQQRQGQWIPERDGNLLEQ